MKISPNIGLNIPEGNDVFDYEKFLKDNLTKIDENITKIPTSQEIVATEGQTVFNLASSYAVGENVLSVEVDGVPQDLGTGFLETSETSITLTEGVPAGAIISVTTFNLPKGVNTQLAAITSQLAELETTNIMDYGVTVDKTGGNADTTTQAIINAAKSGKRVIFPEGTYAINQTIVLSQFTEFVSNGKVTFKIAADVDVFWITADNVIRDITIDVTGLSSYTHNIFEISSASRNTLTTFSQAGKHTCKIEKITLSFSNSNTVDTTSSVFNIWAKPTDGNGVAYPTFAKAFFNIIISEIYVQGAFAYFMRNWVWNPNYYVSSSDIDAWITGVTVKDVSVFGSFFYGIFDAPNETAILDEHYHGIAPMWVDNMRVQYGARVKRFAYLTDGLKHFKNCIPWDFPSSSITLLKRTLATYIVNNRPYVSMDVGYGSKYYFFDVVDTSGNLVTSTARNDWIDSRIASYRDGGRPMNEIIEALTFKDAPVIIKKQGQKSWQITRSTNSNLIFVPSATIDGVDWDYSKNVTINADTGVLYASSISENGTLLPNKYMSKTAPSITDSFTLSAGAPLISKQTGRKSWQIIRSSNDNLIFVPSATIDGTDWDYSKQILMNGDGSLYASVLTSPIVKSTGAAPATATSTGTTGQIASDSNYVYVCVATNTWKRAALSTW